MEKWKIVYYSSLVLSLLIFLALFFIGIERNDSVLIGGSFLFAIIVVVLANRYRTVKEPERMADINRSIPPLFLALLGLLVPVALFIIVIKFDLAVPIGSRFLILFVTIPGFVLNVLAFLMAESRLKPLVVDRKKVLFNPFPLTDIFFPELADIFYPNRWTQEAFFAIARSYVTGSQELTMGAVHLLAAMGMSVITSYLWIVLSMLTMIFFK